MQAMMTMVKIDSDSSRERWPVTRSASGLPVAKAPHGTCFRALPGRLAPGAPRCYGPASRVLTMHYVTSKDGTQIFFKDWGPKSARPLVFHHGWPLGRRLGLQRFLQKVPVVAHDRRARSLGRSARGRHGPLRRGHRGGR